MGSPSPSSAPKLKRSSSTSRAQGPHRRSSSSISCVSMESGDQDLLYSSPAKIVTGLTGKSNVIPSSPRTPTSAAGAASPAALKKRRSSIGGLDDLAKGLDFGISSSSPVNEEKKLHSFLTKGGGHKKVSPAATHASGSPGKKAGSPVPGPREKLTVSGRAALSPSRKSSESSKKDMASSPQKLPEVSRSMNGLTTPKKSSPLRASLDSKMLQAKLSSPRLTPKSTKAVRTLSELAAADALLEGEFLKVQTFSPGYKKTERRPSPSPSLRSKSSGPKSTPSPPQLGRSRSRTDKGAAHTHAPELLRPEMQSVTVYSEYEFDKEAVKKTPDHANMVRRDEEAEERSTLLASLIQGSGNNGITGVSSLDHEPTSWLSEDNVCMFSSLSQLPEPDDGLVLGDPPIKVLDEPVSSNGYASAISSSNGVYDHHGSVDHELNSFCDMLDDPDDGFEAQLCTERDATFEPPQVDTFEAELRTQIETTFDSPQLSVPQFVEPVVAVTSESVHRRETSLIESDVSSSAGDDQSTVVIDSFLQSCSSQDLQTGEAQSQDLSEEAPMESAEVIRQLDQVAEDFIPNVKLEEGRRAIVEDEISTTEEQEVESSDDESLEEIVEDSQVNLKQSFDEVAESQNRDVDEFDHVVPVMVDSPREVTSSEPYTIDLQELALSTESEFFPQLHLDGPKYNLDQDMKIFEEDWTQSTADDAGLNDAEDLLLLNTTEDEAETSLPPVELPVSVLPVTGILKLNVVESDQPHATKLEIVEQPPPDSTVSSDNHHAEVGATKLEFVEETPPEEDPVPSDMDHHAEVGATTVESAREILSNDDPHSPDHHARVSATELEIVEETPPDSPVSLERYLAELVGATKLEILEETPPEDAPDSPVPLEWYHAELVGATKLAVLGEIPSLEDAPDSPVSLERYHAELVGATKLEALGETPLDDAPDSPVSPERYHAEFVGATKLEVQPTKLEILGETPLEDAPDSAVSLERYHAELVGATKLEALGETPLEDAPGSPVSAERYHAELVGAAKLEVLGETPPDSTVSSEYHQVDAAYEEEDEESDEVFHLYGAGSDEVILFDVVGSPLRPEEPLNPILFQDVGESDSYVDLHEKDVEGVELFIKNFPPHDTSGNDVSSSATGDVCVDHEEPTVKGVNIHNFEYDEYLHLEPARPDLSLGTTVQDGSCETSGVSDRHIAHVQSSGLEPSPANPITLEAVEFEGREDDCNLKDLSRSLIPVDSETDEISHALDWTDVEDGQTLLRSGAATKEVDSSEPNAVGGIIIDKEQASVMEDESFHGDGGTTTRQETIENSIPGPEVQMTIDPELEHQGVYISEEGARGKLELDSTEFRDNSFQDTSLSSRDMEVTVQHSSQIIHGDEEDQRISAIGVDVSDVDLEPQMVQSPVIVTLEDFSASDDDSVHNTFEDDIIPDESDAESEVISTASLDVGTEAPTAAPICILGKDEIPFVFSAKKAPIIEFGKHDQIICEDDHSIVGSNVGLGEQHASKEMKPLLTVDDQCDLLHEESDVFHGRANPYSQTQEADARGDFTTEELMIDEASSVVNSTTPIERREHHDVNIRETPFLFGTSVDHVSRTEDGPEVEKALSEEDGHAMEDAGIFSGNSTESQGLPSQVTLNGDDETIKGDLISDSSWKGDTEGESLEHNLSPEDVMDNIEKSVISSDRDSSSLDGNVDDREEDSTVYLNGRLQQEPILFEDEEEVVFSAKTSNGCASLGPDMVTIGKDEEDTTEKSLLEVEDTSDGASDIHVDLTADSEEDCFEEHAVLKDAHMAVESLDVAEVKEQSNPSACKDEDVLEDEENGVDDVVVQETLETKDFDVCDVQNHSHVSWRRADNDEVESYDGNCVEDEPMPVEVDEDTEVYRSMELCVESGQDLPDSTPHLVDEGLEKVDPAEVNLNGEVVQDSVSEAERAMPGVEEAMVEAHVEIHEESPLMVDEETSEEEETLTEDIVGKESTVEMVDDGPTSEESRDAPDVLHANAEKGDVEKEIQHPLWRTDEEGETSVKETPTVEVEEKEMSSPEESFAIRDEDISDLEKETQHPTWKADEGGETLPEDRVVVEEKEEKESHVVSDEDIANASTSDADEGESTSNGHLEEETVVQLKDQENGSSGHEVPDSVSESLGQSENTECHSKTESDAMTSDKDTDEVLEDAVKVKVSGPKEVLVISDKDDTNADISDVDQAESTSNGNLEEETVAQVKDEENGSNGNVLVCQVPEHVNGSLHSDSMGEELVHHSNGKDKDISTDVVKIENYHADNVDEGEESETLALVKETWISGLERNPHEDMDSPDEEPQAAALYPLQPPFSGSKQDHLWEEQAEAYSSGGQGTPSCSHKLATAPPDSAQPFSCDDQIQPASGTVPAMEPKGKDKLHTPLRSLLLEDAHMKAMDGTPSATSNGSPSFIRRLFRVKSTPSRAASERDLTQRKLKKSSSMWVSCLGSPQVKP